MSFVYYTARPGHNYLKYLEERSHFEYTSSAISNEIRRNTAVVRNDLAFVDQKLAAQNTLLQRQNSAIEAQNSLLHWGFSEIISNLDMINISLQDIVAAIKSQAKNWAEEQFLLAQTAFNQGLFDDAWYHVNLAIDGNDQHTAYRLDPRFYFLKGYLQLGNEKIATYSFVDPRQAAQTFLEAAKRVVEDNSVQARALVAAGYAAYCSGDREQAILLTTSACRLDPKLAEAHYNLARYYFDARNAQQALSLLDSAIRLQPSFVQVAHSDTAMDNNRHDVVNIINDISQEAIKKYKEIQSELDHFFHKWEKRLSLETGVMKRAFEKEIGARLNEEDNFKKAQDNIQRIGKKQHDLLNKLRSTVPEHWYPLEEIWPYIVKDILFVFFVFPILYTWLGGAYFVAYTDNSTDFAIGFLRTFAILFVVIATWRVWRIQRLIKRRKGTALFSAEAEGLFSRIGDERLF